MVRRTRQSDRQPARSSVHLSIILIARQQWRGGPSGREGCSDLSPPPQLRCVLPSAARPIGRGTLQHRPEWAGRHSEGPLLPSCTAALRTAVCNTVLSVATR